MLFDPLPFHPLNHYRGGGERKRGRSGLERIRERDGDAREATILTPICLTCLINNKRDVCIYIYICMHILDINTEKDTARVGRGGGREWNP